MAKHIEILTDAKIRAAKPKLVPRKLRDGAGLYLLVAPSGSRLWRFRYRKPHARARPEGEGRRQGRPENMLALGNYPTVTLAAAREKALGLRRLLEAGKDPATEAEAKREQRTNTFEAIAQEWLGKQTLADVTRSKAEWLFSLVLPDIGACPIAELEAPEILKALQKIEAKGHNETANRVKQRVGQVFRFAVATGRAKHDPTSALRGALKAPDVTNRAALTNPADVGKLLRAIDGYVGQPATHAALKLAPLTFVRPGELRGAEWREFDLDGDAPQWRIPGERMKMGDAHIVPLAKQAVAILREIQPLTGRGKYLFPSLRAADRPMSNNTVNAALRRLGYGTDEMTGHGFRAMASTLLNEQGFPPDVIELQLAHAERNKVRAAYNRAQRLPERRKMMQAWADYLDGLKAGGNVVAIKRARASNPAKGATI
ncbi:MAG: tyrosine-type recombinase/integrase [Steroidobacteraceae bacterium]